MVTGGREPARVLWVTEEPPDKSRGGGSIRQAHLFDAVARAMPTDLLMVGMLTDERVRALAAGVIEVPRRRAIWTEHRLARRALQLIIAVGSRHPAQAYFAGRNRRSLARALRQIHPAYDVVIVEHEALGSLAPVPRDGRWVLELHHLFSVMAAQQLRLEQGAHRRWLWAWERRKAQRFECRLVERFDRVIVCSPQDGAELEGLMGAVPAGRIAVVPNGVDVASFPITPVPSEPRILFPGVLGYLPNVDGARWFCTEVFPHVRAAVPEARVELVGREPVAEVLELARLAGVSVHADVPSMRPYFEAARTVVVPLRIGTGTRLKALEAMAAARPLVGTSVGLEGLGIVDGEHARIADDAAALGDAVVAVLTDDVLARRLAAAGRAHVEAQFGWEPIGARLVGEVRALFDDVTRSEQEGPVSDRSSAERRDRRDVTSERHR